MQFDTAGLRNSVGRNTVRSVSKLVLLTGLLVFLLYLGTLLPGMDRIIPATAVSFGGLVTVIITIAVVALLLKLAGSLAALTALVVSGPEPIVEHLAGAVHWLVVLAAILVAHRGFLPVAEPLFDGRLWVYDALFLLVALPVLVVVAVRLYLSIDPASDAVAERVAAR